MTDTNNSQTPAVNHQPAGEEQVRLKDYLEQLDRRKWVALGVFIIVMGLTVLSLVRTTPMYAANVTMIRSLTDESRIFGRGAVTFWTPVPRMANYIELIRSRDMADRVAEHLPETMKFPAGWLRGMISARAIRDTDVIQLTATAPSPAAAIVVANTYAETYVEYDLEQSRSDVASIREFVEEQLAMADIRLTNAEQKLAEFKRMNRLTDLDSETKALVERHAGFVAARRQAEIEFQVNESRLALVQDQIEEGGSTMSERLEVSTSPLVASLRDRLSQLEVEKANILMRGFDGSSERVRGLERQIDSTRNRLRQESRLLVEQGQFGDPVGQLDDLFESRLFISTELAASRTRQQALSRAEQIYRNLIAQLPDLERQMAELIREVQTEQRVYSLLAERLEEARIQEYGRTPSMRVVDRAQGAYRTRPNVQSSLAFGLGLALVLALGIAWVVEQLDTAVRSQRDLERRGLSVLASVPELPRGKGTGKRRDEQLASRLITHAGDEASMAAEAFRILRTAIEFAGITKPHRVIAVTSPGPGEGKSTVAVNLATVLAQAGSRVLLVDCDLRNPVLHRVFKRKRTPGLTDLILAPDKLNGTITPTGIDRLSFLPAGTLAPSPADLFTAPTTRAFFKRAAEEYDCVVIDTPPVMIAADTTLIGALADTTIMIVRAGRTTFDALDHARNAMLNARANLAGVVLNGIDPASRYGRYYYYYKYNYRYGEKKGRGRSSGKADEATT